MSIENFRIGQGIYIRPLIENRKLTLAGVEIESGKGAAKDVLSQAVAKAFLNALDLNHLRAHSLTAESLQQTYDLVLNHGFQLNNLDSVIILAQPRLAEFIHPMRAKLSEMLETPLDRINVKAKSGNGVGKFGRGETIAAMAIVSIYKV